jgi:uncharacterized protein YecT (DUF1311 family)
MRRLILLACMAIMPASMAHADDCAKAADQMTMNLCADKAFKKADTDLNAIYKQIQQRLKSNPDTAKLLIPAQRGWVGFRDAECKFSSSGVGGGSMYPMIYSGCAEKLTKVRINDLKAYLTCPEGDTSCPVPPN